MYLALKERNMLTKIQQFGTDSNYERFLDNIIFVRKFLIVATSELHPLFHPSFGGEALKGHS